MATSDSEDFESADEDIEDSKTLSLDKNIQNQGIANLGVRDVSSSSCSSTLTSSGGETALTAEPEVDRLETTTKHAARCESNTVTTDLERLDISKVADSLLPKAGDKRNAKPRQHKTKQPKSTGIKKLGTKITLPGKRPEAGTGSLSDDCVGGNVRKLKSSDSSDTVSCRVAADSFGGRQVHVDGADVEDKQSSVDRNADDSLGKGGGGWGGWSSWGVSSLLSSATEGVASLTSQVSQGLSTVLEAGIGAPDPEELARVSHEQAQAIDDARLGKEDAPPAKPEESSSVGVFGLGQLMSGVSSITRLVENTGSRVITGGLDTLETIGKKTMEVLQEGDPGLKKKRALFTDKTVLSQVLREAKERAEEEDLLRDERQQARKAHFETLFDDYQGLVHLEALEMLSKQCELKLQSTLLTRSGPGLAALQRSQREVKELCRLPEEEETEEDTGWQATLVTAVADLGVPFSTTKMVKTWNEMMAWLEGEGQDLSASEVHRKAMESLAHLTAEAVEQYHKVAELLLVREARDPYKEAQLFVQVTSAVTSALNLTAARFSEHLSKCAVNPSPDEVNNLITKVFLEANNSSSYVEEALRLLVPILQVALDK